MPTLETIEGVHVVHDLRPHTIIYVDQLTTRAEREDIFPDVITVLGPNYGSVLFDCNDYDRESRTLFVNSLDVRKRRLQAVERWVRRSEVKRISIVALSLGCLATALAKPEGLEQLVFIAPPTTSGEAIRAYCIWQGGREEGDYYAISKSNDRKVLVASSLFKEPGTEKIILDYAEQQPLTVVQALNDEYIPDQEYNGMRQAQNIRWVGVAGDHNFTYDARPGLLNVVASLFLGDKGIAT